MTAGVAIVAILLHKGAGIVTMPGEPMVAPKGSQWRRFSPVWTNGSTVTAFPAAFGADRAALAPIGMENES